MLHHLRILSILIVLCFAMFSPMPLFAQSAQETPTTTLVIENSSDSNLTVCDIFALREPNELVIDQQEQITLTSGRTITFAIPTGEYRLLITDCEQNILYQVSRVSLTNTYVIKLTASLNCATEFDRGKTFYNQQKYDQALEAWLKTATCYHEANDFAKESTSLWSVAGIYALQGNVEKALVTYSQSLTAIQKVSDQIPGKHILEADITLKIGAIYFEQGKCTNSLEKFDATLLIIQENKQMLAQTGTGESLLWIGQRYFTQNHLDDALSAYELANAVFHEQKNRRLESSALAGIGSIYGSQGLHDKALQQFEQALTLLSDEDRLPKADIMTRIGGVYMGQGHYAQALQQLEDVSKFLSTVTNDLAIATLSAQKGSIYALQGRNAEALKEFNTALTLQRKSNDWLGVTQTLVRIGETLGNQGQVTDALANFEEALKIGGAANKCIALRDEILNNIGTTHLTQGKYADALSKFNESLALQKEIDDRAGMITSLSNIASVYEKQGRYAESLQHFQQALDNAETMNNRLYQIVLLTSIGRHFAIQGRYSEALKQAERALAIANELGLPSQQASALNGIGAVYTNQGRYAEALDKFNQALAMVRNLESPGEKLQTLAQIANVYTRQGRYPEALQLFKEATKIAQGIGSPEHENHIQAQIAAVYSSQGRYIEALDLFTKTLLFPRAVGNLAEEASIQTNIASVYISLSRYDEAIALLKQAVTVFQEADLPVQAAHALASIAKIQGIRGDYQAAVEAYEQALARLPKAGNPSDQIQFRQDMAEVYVYQGRYTKALGGFQQALDDVQALGNRELESAIYNAIAVVYSSQGRLNEALDFHQKSLTLLEEIGNPLKKSIALHGIGTVYSTEGDFNQALQQFEAALAIQEEIGNDVLRAATLNNIANIYVSQGRQREALRIYEDTLAIFQDTGDRHGEANALNNIATFYIYQLLATEALTRTKQALVIQREIGDRIGEADTLSNFGSAYLGLGRYGEALESYQQALALQQEIELKLEASRTKVGIANVYSVQGRPAEALALLEQVLSVAEEAGELALQVKILNNLAGVNAQLGNLEQAFTFAKQASDLAHDNGMRFEEAYALGNLASLYSMKQEYDKALEINQDLLLIWRSMNNRALEGRIHFNISAIYEAQGRDSEALDALDLALSIAQESGERIGQSVALNGIGFIKKKQGHEQEALQYYTQTLAIVETIRTVAGDDLARTTYANTIAPLYDNLIDLTFTSQPDLAFRYSEQGRARSLLDSILTGRFFLNDNQAATLLDQEQKFYALRQLAQDALAKARAANPPNPDWVSEAEAALSAAKASYEQATTAITQRSDQLATLIPGRQQVPQLADVQAMLPADTTLLSYWTLEDKTLAFVITAQDADIVELPSVTAQTVLTMTTNLLQWHNREVAYPLPLRQLYTALIAPLADKLQTPHLAIIPHQSLHYVPFAALINEAHKKQYLGEKYTLTLLPSASVLPFLQQNATAAQANPTGGAVVFGDPASNEPGLPRLQNAAAEASAVAALLATTVLTDTAATEALLYQMAADARIVHLAAHGQYNSINALYSALYLAPTSPLTATNPLSPTAGLPTVDSTLDGRLETWEIFGLPLKGNDLVVLSACETTVNDLAKENRVALSRGDELVSLTRAFIFAGAPTVIASLWSVDDAATETLMVAFYKHWLEEGMSKAAALQAAQADVRREPQWVSPFYWAGFVLHGDPGASGAK